MSLDSVSTDWEDLATAAAAATTAVFDGKAQVPVAAPPPHAERKDDLATRMAELEAAVKALNVAPAATPSDRIA